jgi:hypothetical protein
MKKPRIKLEISDGKIKATAVDKDGNVSQNGDLNTSPGAEIDWSHETKKEELKKFDVTFLKVNDNNSVGWPFDDEEPDDKKLQVRHDKLRRKKLKTDTELKWKYVVEMTGYEKLDPMIIIRGNVVKDYTVAVALAVIGGLVVAGLLAYWYLRQ